MEVTEEFILPKLKAILETESVKVGPKREPEQCLVKFLTSYCAPQMSIFNAIKIIDDAEYVNADSDLKLEMKKLREALASLGIHYDNKTKSANLYVHRKNSELEKKLKAIGVINYGESLGRLEGVASKQFSIRKDGKVSSEYRVTIPIEWVEKAMGEKRNYLEKAIRWDLDK